MGTVREASEFIEELYESAGNPVGNSAEGTGQRREEPKSEGDQRTHQSRGIQWEIMERRGTECDFRSPLSMGAWVPTLTRNC